MAFPLKKIILAALLSSMVYNISLDDGAPRPALELPTSAAAAVVMGEDGACLYEKNADEPRLIASTTKLMTALVSIELSEPEQRIEIRPESCGVEGSSMYLRAGEVLTADELIAGLLLCSGNDAAEALAFGLCGSEESFVTLMNEKAAALGLHDTAFANPHGLDAEGHFSTARDLARLMLVCMRDARFRRLCALPSLTVGENNYVNHNKLLECCEGCLGGKTGYTRAAGRCLVSCCEREGKRLVCVTLSDPDDWEDHLRLYDAAFEYLSQDSPIKESNGIMEERLQKIIAASGLMSRRAAEELIAAGKVRVNGETASLGDRADAARDRITVNGRALAPPEEKVYIMLNKPRGYVTTLRDEKGRKTVAELVEELGLRLYPVGRLDINSEGLLIMTNDGAFAERLTHPRGGVEKCYRTSVTGEDIPAAAEKMREPMLIDGYRTRGARVEIERLTDTGGVLLITISEGRNRQVRKMCEQTGLRVTRLCRISEGGLRLGELKSGRWRRLTRAEIARLRGTVEHDGKG